MLSRLSDVLPGYASNVRPSQEEQKLLLEIGGKLARARSIPLTNALSLLASTATRERLLMRRLRERPDVACVSLLIRECQLDCFGSDAIAALVLPSVYEERLFAGGSAHACGGSVLLAKNGTRALQIFAYSGEPVPRDGGPMVIVCDGVEISNPTPLLRDHDAAKVIGFGEAKKTKDSILVNGTLSNVTEAAKEVRDLADESYQWQASINVQIKQWDVLSSDDTEQINGRAVTGPMRVVRKSLLREVSVCALGADASTRVLVSN